MDAVKSRQKIKGVIDFLTFTNLPIRKKFIVFALGVLFWFLVLFFVSTATLVVIRHKSNLIVHQLIPHDRTIHAIVGNLKDAVIDASTMARAANSTALLSSAEAGRARLEDIRDFALTLQRGGQINDRSLKDYGQVESYSVESLAGDPEGSQFLKNLDAELSAANKQFDDLIRLKTAVLNGSGDHAKFDAVLAGFVRSLEQASALSKGYSGHIANRYTENASDIGFDFLCTFAAVIVVLLLATSLLAIFTFWISHSITTPVRSITNQIRSLRESDVSDSRQIEVLSTDEIGTLSAEFNTLMQSIYDLTSFKRIIEEDNSLEDVYSRLAHMFRHELGFDIITIYEIANSQNKMKTVYPFSVEEEKRYCNGDIFDNCQLCRVKKTGHTVSSFLHPEMCKSFLIENDCDYTCLPMDAGGITSGVVQFVFPRTADAPPDRQDIERRLFKAQQYINESVSVIDAKRLMATLKDSALKDALTGLYNRRFLQEYTESLVAGILRREKQIGLIMCDLDYFKQVNDVYGHHTGDAVLKETSEIIRSCVRTSDLVIRFGGEEFLIVLLDVTEGISHKIAEKVRMSLEQAKLKIADGVIKKTISLGISEFPTDTESFWQAIKFADVALYRAKETGRNRTIRFLPEMWKGDQF